MSHQESATELINPQLSWVRTKQVCWSLAAAGVTDLLVGSNLSILSKWQRVRRVRNPQPALPLILKSVGPSQWLRGGLGYFDVKVCEDPRQQTVDFPVGIRPLYPSEGIPRTSMSLWVGAENVGMSSEDGSPTDTEFDHVADF